MKKISHINLFLKLFIINTITFGGGYTIIPIIKSEFVDNYYINEDEMLDMISIAQSIPGVMTISTSYLLGRKLKGQIGGIIAVLASTLPCIIIIGIIAKNYNLLIKNETINNILTGLSGSILALLLITIFEMIKKQRESNKKYLYFFISIVSIILKLIFNLNIVFILLIISIIALLVDRGDKIV